MIRRGDPVCVCQEGKLLQSIADRKCPRVWSFGGLQLTAKQVKDLRKAGCRFDALDRKVARNLLQRGFGSRDFVESYWIYTYHKKSFKELADLPRDRIVTIAKARSLKMDSRRILKLLQAGEVRRKNLTDSSFLKTDVGAGLLAGGAVGIVVGVIGTIIGIVLITYPTDGCTDNDAYCADRVNVGAWMTGTGGVVTIVGIVLAAVGGVIRKRRVSKKALENKSRETRQMEATDRLDGGQKSDRIIITPYVGSNSGGLGFTVRF
ncbi:hypothetical protein ACFL51_01490 [Myxococcota bacterium]